MKAGIISVVLTRSAREICMGSGPRSWRPLSYTNWWPDQGGLFQEDTLNLKCLGSPYGEEDAIAIHNTLTASDGNAGTGLILETMPGVMRIPRIPLKGMSLNILLRKS